jgi:hypothetical protein
MSHAEQTPVMSEPTGLRNKAARDAHRKAILAASRVVRHHAPETVGKVIGVYGATATATKVAVAWGDDTDLTPHFAIGRSSDEYIEDLATAPAS